jgi:hypothetical protein
MTPLRLLKLSLFAAATLILFVLQVIQHGGPEEEETPTPSPSDDEEEPEPGS